MNQVWHCIRHKNETYVSLLVTSIGVGAGRGQVGGSPPPTSESGGGSSGVARIFRLQGHEGGQDIF